MLNSWKKIGTLCCFWRVTVASTLQRPPFLYLGYRLHSGLYPLREVTLFMVNVVVHNFSMTKESSGQKLYREESLERAQFRAEA